MDTENEWVELENEGVDNAFLSSEQEWYCLRNPTTIKYNNGRACWRFMGSRNLIIGSHALHNVTKAYVNVINFIATFDEPNPPTNITTNDTFLTKYRIKQGLKVFEKNAKNVVKEFSLPQSCQAK